MRLSSEISAVVTGGASGLGKATAQKLRAEGVKVALFDRNEDLGKAVAAELGAVFCKVDVTSDESVDAGFAQARKANGQERGKQGTGSFHGKSREGKNAGGNRRAVSR